MDNINLPMSLGEALDKLTILDIKMNKIKDGRLDDVKKEHSILFEKLKEHIENVKFHYTILKGINLDIWEMQDTFRYSKGDKAKLCLKIIEDNDRRFRVKKKINYLTNSSLKEQKGYKPKRAFVLTHLGLGDNITAIGMVRYLSTCYDEVVVVCKCKNKDNVELFYQDDPSIKPFPVQDDKYVSPNYGFNINNFKRVTHGYTLYLCGSHNLDNRKCYYNNIPYCFYEQLNLDPRIFWNYFHIPTLINSMTLFQQLNTKEYVFVHNTSSTGQVFSIRHVENRLNIDRNNILFINPNVNCYPNGSPFREIASKFIGHKLAYYIEIIKNAKYNIFSDSSFMCMALNLDMQNDNNYFISRSKGGYELLYSDKYKNNNKKRIKRL